MKPAAGKVSIMMPVYNGEKYIESAIQSVVSQSYQNWELIIVNDGSTDQTTKILEKFSDQRIKKLHQKNQGEAAARNTALANMEGEYLAFLDADDLFFPDFLKNMIDFLANRAELDACYCDGWYIDTDGNQLDTLSKQRRGPFENNIFEALVRASDVFGPPTCTLIRREIVSQQAIQFDTRIIIGPDWDFFIKVAQFANWGYLEFKGVKYRVHQTNITLTTSSIKRQESLALCRENAIHNTSFEHCSNEVRYYVFYDLLINIIFDQPERQDAWIQSAQFSRLSRKDSSKILRLTAAKSISQAQTCPLTKGWLKKSILLNPFDFKTWLIYFLNGFSPNIAQKILITRHNSVQSPNNSPFKINAK
jgi:glycosyltransferase involved in cell wall biosynthesis